MSARKHEINIQLNQLIDALLLGLAFWVAYEIRSSGFFIVDALWEIPPFLDFLWMLAILMPFGPFFLEVQGFYSHPLEKTPARSLDQIMRAGIWLTLFFALAAFLFRLGVPSRSVLILFAVLAPCALLIKDQIIRGIHIRKLRRGQGGEEIIIAGEPQRLREFEHSLSPVQKLETRIVAQVDLASGEISDLVEQLHRHPVGRVILEFERIELEKVQLAVAACEAEGVEAWLNADFIKTSVARPTYESFGMRPMLVFRATPEISWSLMIKSSIDRVGAFLVIFLLSPLFLLIGLAVALTSRGPVIFRQQRAGLHGRPFTMFKFRTMCKDAESKRQELEERNEMTGPVFKVANDPRVTPIGRLLRRTSMDELPQLYNVLRGDMSLVGPRPLPLYELAKFERVEHRRRLSMKPGLTCLWQIRGRNQVCNFDDWVRMDLEYIDNWTLGLDLVILVRTVPAVLAGWGAK